jgi:hypothetical protein
MGLVCRWRDHRCHPAAEVTPVSSHAAAAGSQRAQSRGGAMAWLMLVTAGLFETGFAVFLKLSHGLTKFWPTVGFAACALISFGLLTLALRELEVGPAYAVWTGIGAPGHGRKADGHRTDSGRCHRPEPVGRNTLMAGAKRC